MAGALDYEDDLCTVALIFRNIRILCNLETKFYFYFGDSVFSEIN